MIKDTFDAERTLRIRAMTLELDRVATSNDIETTPIRGLADIDILAVLPFRIVSSAVSAASTVASASGACASVAVT